MATTQVRSEQIGDTQIKRADLNTATSGSAVVTKIIGGTNVTLGSTGADAGTGDVTINASSGGGMTWTEVTGTSQTAATSTGYLLNNVGLVTLTLPDTAALGSVVRVVGKGAGGWRVAQNASENIRFGNQVTTTGTGGRLDSTNQYDCVELLCTVADTTWTVISSIGNITIT